MKKKPRKISYKKERVVFSDVLPFETPITFTNRHFYQFLIENQIELSSADLIWRDNGGAVDTIVKLLFDFRFKIPRSFSIDAKEFKAIKLDDSSLKTIPFNYKINHGESSFRELSIVHPKNQVHVVYFYNKFKNLIIYYCNVGSFSIRKPAKIASSKFFKDSIHKTSTTKESKHDAVEELGKEYENLKTFFVYKNYSNIHKFYESYKYHRCEKKYDRLYKFDISKCFDSIYTHSISWAVINKEIVKEKITASKKTFGGIFDSLMQNLNYSETNGIVIGPEFSRVFAEIILQKVDRTVENNLRTKYKLAHKVDYEIFRYVDDYFIFYNTEEAREKVQTEFKLQLREYKLAVNDLKTLNYEKPIITEVTIAKQLISELLSENFFELPDSLASAEQSIDNTIHVSSNHVITAFKTIVKDTKVSYKDIMNYTLSLIDRKVTDLISYHYSKTPDKSIDKKLVKSILEILDITFFLYSISPRVNTTIKLIKILHQIIDIFKENSLHSRDFKDIIYKKIYDNLHFNLRKNRSTEHVQVETLYLLITLRELGKEYLLDKESVWKYFCLTKGEDSELKYSGNLNYFSIVVLLFYIKEKKQYEELRRFVKDHIIFRFSRVKSETMGKSTELVLLLFDILTCPFLDLDFKKQILSLNGVNDAPMQESIIGYREHWFTTWKDFKLGLELEAKHGREVY